MNDKIRKAQQASQAIQSDFLKGAFADVRKYIHKGIETSGYAEVDTREHLYYMLKATEQLESVFFKYIREGQVALHGLDGQLKQIKR